jgi:hypothetical protein
MVASPGEIAPSQCSVVFQAQSQMSSHLEQLIAIASGTTTALPTSSVAGVTYFFNLITRDIYGNLVQTWRRNTNIVVIARYENHDSYLSTIGVNDFTDWERIYGTNI